MSKPNLKEKERQFYKIQKRLKGKLKKKKNKTQEMEVKESTESQ